MDLHFSQNVKDYIPTSIFSNGCWRAHECEFPVHPPPLLPLSCKSSQPLIICLLFHDPGSLDLVFRLMGDWSERVCKTACSLSLDHMGLMHLQSPGREHEVPPIHSSTVHSMHFCSPA